MPFRVPSAERRLSQTNSSQVQGNLYQTRNIDLDEEGVIKLAAATVSLYDETDDADFNNVHSMFHGSQVYFVGNDLFRDGSIDFAGISTNVSATDTTPPTPGSEQDGVFFNNTEVVSDSTSATIRYNSSGTWTTIAGTPSSVSGAPIALETFPNQNSLLVGHGNSVARVNSSWTVAVTLTLPTSYRVLSIATNGNYAYIATRHLGSGEAMLFLWTGINTTNDGSYGVGTHGIGSVRKYQSSVALIDSLGRLLQFNGSGFTELGALPVYYSRTNWGDAANDYANVYNRGLVVDGDIIYINIANETRDSNYSYLPNQLGNVWCYDPKVGLYQRYSYTNTEILTGSVTTANINTDTDVFTVSGATVPNTGSICYFGINVNTLGNFIPGRIYYVINQSSTTMKVAETYRDAMNGTAVNLGALTGTEAYTVYFVSQLDYGQGLEAKSGATIIFDNTEYEDRQLARVGITGETYTNQMTTVRWRYMQTSNAVRNLGYIVTPKMFADNAVDTFIDLTLRFKPLDYGDKITVKYRNEDKLRFPVMPNSDSRSDSYVSWTSSTVFTTLASPDFNFYDMTTVEIGDEVEIIGGSGSGFIAHVSNISRSGFQYTVTIDTANPFYQSGDTSMVKIDNWKVLEVINGTTYTDTQKTFKVDSLGGWVQFKIVMEGVGISIYDTFITNKYAASVT